MSRNEGRPWRAKMAALVFAGAVWAAFNPGTLRAQAGFPAGGANPVRPQTIPTIPSGPPGAPDLPSPAVSTGNPLSVKQKDAILRENFKKTKKDVAKLSEMVQSLQKEIDKSNPNLLSLKLVNQASKIEKLAKKIRDEAKSY